MNKVKINPILKSNIILMIYKLFSCSLSRLRNNWIKCISFILSIFLSLNCYAQSVIRDAEIENAISQVITPIIKVAGLSPSSVHFYIMQDSEINSFVSGGQNIFINTGLLRLSQSPNMLVGVIAHETGHIADGHLAKGQNAGNDIMLKSTAGFLLGLAATVAGSPQAGIAIVSGTGHIANRELIAYTRSQEEEADQAAFRFLDKLGISSQGMLSLMEILYNKENTLYGKLNPYTQNHPLTSERVDYIRAHIKSSNPQNYKDFSSNLKEQYKMAIIKLIAFLDPPSKTLQAYPATDKSNYALYARAIAYYREPNIQKSLSEIDQLINRQVNNPYYHEMKGQILFENGRINEAINSYSAAKKLLPHSPLIKIELASAYLATENPAQAQLAINDLQQALVKEPDNGFIWHQLAVAYGLNNQLDLTNIALAEEALLSNDVKMAEEFTNRAKKYIKLGSPADRKLQDLLELIKQKKDKNDRT